MNHKTAIVLSGVGMVLMANPTMAIAQSTTNSASTASASTGSNSNLRLSTGINFSSGNYGEIEATEVFSIPVSLTYRSGNFKVRVSAPWVWINGPGSLLQTPEGRDGGGGGGDGGRSNNSGRGSANSGSGSSGGSDIEVEDEDDDERVDDDGVAGSNGVTLADNRRSGIGDVNVAMTYSFNLGSGFYFEPTAKVKLPTASVARRLGTGHVDVTLSGDLVREIGPASLYVHGRHKFAGTATGSTIRSTSGFGGGASVRAAPGFTIGADYDWQQSAFAGRQASSEVTGWANVRLNRAASLTFFASTGLNANSVDLSTGASVSMRF